MGYDAKTERLIALKKLAGKAQTSNDKGLSNEALPSGITSTSETIFGETITTSPSSTSLYTITGKVEYVRFPASFIAGSDTSDGRHGFELKLPSDYESNSSNSKAGTYPFQNNQTINITSGSLQLVPTSFATSYEAKPYYGGSGVKDSGTQIPLLDARDWYLDYFNGVFFQQDPSGTGDQADNPDYIEAYLYIGDMLDTIVTNAGDSGGGDTSAQYLVLAATGSLTAERVLTAGTGISTTDAGAGGAYTVAVNNSVVATLTGSQFSGTVGVTGSIGSTSKITSPAFSGSLTHLQDGTSYIKAGTNITVASASNGSITITSANTTYTAGDGLDLSGTEFSTDLKSSGGLKIDSTELAIDDSIVATISGSTFTGAVKFNSGLSGSLTHLADGTSYIKEGSNVTVTSGSNGSITIASTNTTYTAGDGLDLSGTEFSVDLKSSGGLEIDSTELAIDDSIVATISGSTFTGAVKFNSGLSGSLTHLANGTSYLREGSNVGISTGSDGSITISSSAAGDGDSSAQYLVLAATGSLSAERVFTAGTGISTTDAGAGAAYTIAVDNSVVATISGSTFTGAVKFNSGLSGSLTHLADGTSYLIAGSNTTIATGSSGAITISSAGSIDGSGAANRIATWSDSNTLTSDADFTWNGSLLDVQGDANINGTLVVNQSGADKNFRVESLNKSSALVVDGETDQVLLFSGSLSDAAGHGSSASDPDPRAFTDTNFFVSGSIDSRGTSRRGTSVFGGDVVVTGAMYVSNPGTGQNVTFYGQDSDAVGMQWIHDTYEHGVLRLGQPDHGVDLQVYGETSGKYLWWNQDEDLLAIAGKITHTAGDVVFNESAGDNDFRVESAGEDEALFLDASSNTLYVNKGSTGFTTVIKNTNNEVFRAGAGGAIFNEYGNKFIDFRIESWNKPYAFYIDSNQDHVLILSGGGVTSPDESTYTDMNFFISGSIGSRNSSTKGTSVFGGDVLSSGSLVVKSGITGSLTQLSDGTSYLREGSNISITSGSNGSVTIAATGGASGAPSDAQYLTLATDNDLTDERVFTAGTGIATTDAGAGSTFTVGIDNSVVATLTGSVFSGNVVAQAGLSGSIQLLSDGATRYIVGTGSINVSTGSSGQLVISSSAGSRKKDVYFIGSDISAGGAVSVTNSDFSMVAYKPSLIDVLLNGQMLHSGTTGQVGNSERDYYVDTSTSLKFAFDVKIDDVLDIIVYNIQE